MVSRKCRVLDPELIGLAFRLCRPHQSPVEPVQRAIQELVDFPTPLVIAHSVAPLGHPEALIGRTARIVQTSASFAFLIAVDRFSLSWFRHRHSPVMPM